MPPSPGGAPPRSSRSARRGRPWKEDGPAARARDETLRATRHYGCAFWKRWTGYHARSRIEARMRCLKGSGRAHRRERPRPIDRRDPRPRRPHEPPRRPRHRRDHPRLVALSGEGAATPDARASRQRRADPGGRGGPRLGGRGAAGADPGRSGRRRGRAVRGDRGGRGVVACGRRCPRVRGARGATGSGMPGPRRHRLRMPARLGLRGRGSPAVRSGSVDPAEIPLLLGPGGARRAARPGRDGSPGRDRFAPGGARRARNGRGAPHGGHRAPLPPSRGPSPPAAGRPPL